MGLNLEHPWRIFEQKKLQLAISMKFAIEFATKLLSDAN
jgi:hypothetical protein